ncbi:MAG: YwaF family protein [Clostridia bacterium]|nr:YwaF family protein [Clostridia bacterium]
MVSILKEFFGFGGYMRIPEGYFSWQHLTFVTLLMLVMIALGVFFGLRGRKMSEKEKNRALIAAALSIDIIELFKIVMMCIVNSDPLRWLYELPLFMCSIQLITIPLAAFSKGRLREAALDFVAIFGLLGAFMGTYFAGQNYSCYPVLSFDNVVSGVTHSISGFAALYILISGMTSMKKKNIPITFSIITGFCVAAYVANRIIDYNYMFLMRGDGTPYDMIYNLVGGHPVAYPFGVLALFLIYITAFYGIYYLVIRKKGKEDREESVEEKELVNIH